MDDLQETSQESQESQESPPELYPGEAGALGDDASSSEEKPRREPLAREARGKDLGFLNNVELNSKHVSAGHIDIAGQVFNQHFNLTSAGKESVRLSARHFKSRTSQELEICEEELVFEDEAVEELRFSLEESRVLVLAGEPEGGKGSLALLIGSRLTRTLEWQGMLICRGISSGLQVDFERVAADEDFGHQVVMFEDALAGENADLKSFLRTIDSIRLTTLQERLRRNSAALLLTATFTSLGESKRRLENLGILRTISPPAPELLIQALHRFAKSLPQEDSRETVASFLAEQEEDLARELKTIPRVNRFVQEYLAEVAQGNLSIRHALGRMDDLSHWLNGDLRGDLEAQSAVLAIAIGSAVAPAEGVPWFAFNDLQRRITELLRKEWRIAEDRPSSPPELDPDFLPRARAYVAILPSPLTDLVRFRDERYSQRLWQALLGPARGLATLMIPLLQELALSSDPTLQEIAVSALGRLGEIGPTHLAVPLLHAWARQSPDREELAGGFLQGSTGSDDQTYKDLCLKTLQDLASEGSVGVAETSIRALSFLGKPDPAVPIRAVCEIAQKRLSIQLDVLREVEQEINAKEEEIRGEVDPHEIALVLKAFHEHDDAVLIAVLVPENQIRLLGAVQYALAGVLFSHGGDLGPVLRAVLVQMKAEPVKHAPLFTYFFLHRQGLIDLLDRYKWISGDFEGRVSRFLLTSRRGERDPEALRELLETIFATLDSFPGFFRSLLERRFLEILKSWGREGCEEPRLRPIVARFLSSLRNSKSSALRRRMERFLETDPDFVVPGSRLRALARDVLDGRGLEDAPPAPSRSRRLPAWLIKPAATDG